MLPALQNVRFSAPLANASRRVFLHKCATTESVGDKLATATLETMALCAHERDRKDSLHQAQEQTGHELCNDSVPRLPVSSLCFGRWAMLLAPWSPWYAHGPHACVFSERLGMLHSRAGAVIGQGRRPTHEMRSGDLVTRRRMGHGSRTRKRAKAARKMSACETCQVHQMNESRTWRGRNPGSIAASRAP